MTGRIQRIRGRIAIVVKVYGSSGVVVHAVRSFGSFLCWYRVDLEQINLHHANSDTCTPKPAGETGAKRPVGGLPQSVNLQIFLGQSQFHQGLNVAEQDTHYALRSAFVLMGEAGTLAGIENSRVVF